MLTVLIRLIFLKAANALKLKSYYLKIISKADSAITKGFPRAANSRKAAANSIKNV